MFSNVGCTKKSSDVTVVTTGLSFTAEIVFDSMEYSCITEIEESNKTVFTFLTPREIKGLRVVFDKDKVNMEYDGLTHTLNNSSSKFIQLELIYKIFKGLKRDGKKSKNDKKEFSLLIDNSEYIIKVGQTGLPIEISNPSKKLFVNIKNATIIE